MTTYSTPVVSHSVGIVNNTTVINNTTANMTTVQSTPTDPMLTFVLIFIAIAILYIILSGINREQRY